MKPAIRSLIVAALLVASLPLAALDVPPPPEQWVTDAAGVLSRDELQRLNAKLRSFEKRSGAQFIIYIFPSLDAEALEDFTIRAAERWKVGQKKYDNGLILFVFIEERRVRIEVGYGLEGGVTDAFSGRVIREEIAPHFRRGGYATGLDAAADRIIAQIERTEAPVPAGGGGEPATSIGDVWPLLVITLIFLIFVAPLLAKGGCGGCGGCLPLLPLGGGRTYGGRGWHGSGGFGGGGFRGGGGGFGGGGASGGW
ncbi:MAG TPA: TPM domain-containing protein [Thermoanaerobaculia bacterium]|nr:TPM domain-containing protein [Thermoanaerobaculia bacterium]